MGSRFTEPLFYYLNLGAPEGYFEFFFGPSEDNSRLPVVQIVVQRGCSLGDNYPW